MAITPMQLPSPKAYDPNQMEMTNLALFKDPYTASGASVRDSQLQLERQLNNEAYAHAVTGQQDYYNRALQAQADESAQELIPKLLHEQHGIGFLTGIPGLQGVLARMQQNAPGLYGQYVNQAFQGEKAKALQAGGAGAKSALEAGLQTPPEEFYGATGVQTGAVTPLQLQIELAKEAAATARHNATEGGLKISEQYGPYETPYGTTNATVGVPKGWTREQINRGLDTAGIPHKGPGTRLPYNPNAPAGQQPVIPPTQGSPPPVQGVKPTGSPAPTTAAPNREAAWDAAKKTLPPNLKPAVDAVERARAQNGGKLVIDEQGRVIGVTPEGRRIPIGRTQ